MNIDRDIEPSRPAPDRDAGRDRDPEHRGHRREYDAKHPRRDFSDRVDGVVRDVAAFRVVALSDLITHQFDGHPFAGRRGIGEAEQRGWIERQTAHGPKGGRFNGRGGDAGRGGARDGAVGDRVSGQPAGVSRGGQDGGYATRCRGVSRRQSGGLRVPDAKSLMALRAETAKTGGTFKETYNQQWLIERRSFRAPAVGRHECALMSAA